MSNRLRFGILGTGNIARQFAAGLRSSRRCVLSAVGSRSADSARAFAAAHTSAAQQAPVAHASYDALIADPTIDAVYVSLPNSLHHEWTIKALRAGKHVLCEKPFASTVAQCQEMFDVARSAGRLVMEAFMYRCHPQTLALERAVREGAIGELRVIRTSFCYRTNKIAGNVRFSPELDGGVLMDVGCYCINFSRHFAGGEPVSIHAEAHRHETGVDDIVIGTLRFASGVLATFTCGMSVQADNTAYLCGTNGYIETPVPWKPPTKGATYTIARSTPPRMDNPSSALPPTPPRETFTVGDGLDLYGIEADDFAASIQDNQPLRIPLEDTLGNMRTIEAIRGMISPS